MESYQDFLDWLKENQPTPFSREVLFFADAEMDRALSLAIKVGKKMDIALASPLQDIDWSPDRYHCAKCPVRTACVGINKGF